MARKCRDALDSIRRVTDDKPIVVPGKRGRQFSATPKVVNGSRGYAQTERFLIAIDMGVREDQISFDEDGRIVFTPKPREFINTRGNAVELAPLPTDGKPRTP